MIQIVSASLRDGLIERLEQGAFDLSDAQTAAFAAFQRAAQTVQEFFAALGRRDAAQTLLSFTDDAVLEGWGSCAASACRGTAAIRAGVEGLIADDAARVLLPLGATRVSGTRLTGRSGLTSRSIRAAGVERIIVRVTGEIRGDRLSFLRLEADESDAQTASYLAATAARR